MKTFLILLLFAVPVYSQSKAFAVKDNVLQWENVFITDEGDIAALLQRHPSLTITSDKANVYKGIGKGVKNSCPGTSGSLIDAQYNFNFEIERSAGMYRVTITKLSVLPSGKGKHAAAAETFFVENAALKAGQQTATNLACLDALFNRMFSATNLLKNKP